MTKRIVKSEKVKYGWAARKSGVTRFKLVKDPEVSLGTGVIKRKIVQHDLRSIAMPNSVWCFEPGDTVHIAKAIISGLGPSYRVMHTCVWLHDEDVEVEPKVFKQAASHIDNNPRAMEFARVLGFVKDFKDSQKSVILNEGQSTSLTKNISDKSSSGFVAEKSTASKANSCNNRNNNPNKMSPRARRIKHMDKKELRNVITQLKASDKIRIVFLGEKAHLTGDYTVLKVRTGRGRGGSKIMDLVDSNKNTISTGTGDSAFILNITANGVFVGSHSPEASIESYPKDLAMAETLRAKFASLLDAEGDYTITVSSPMPELNGTWVVNRAAKVQGRVGQIKLLLEDPQNGRKTELWSYRHSGAVTNFSIVPSDDVESPDPASSDDEDPDQFDDSASSFD